MGMEGAIRVLNDLVRSKQIQRYAIGGAMGAAFYMEPFVTYDLDVFVLTPGSSDSSSVIDLSPLFSFLKQRGFRPKAEHIVIDGIPVQFRPAHSDLLEEAVKEAVKKKVETTTARVIKPEFLFAIMLSVGRMKDKLRAAAMLEQTKLDAPLLEKIIKRHRLQSKWHAFRAGLKP